MRMVLVNGERRDEARLVELLREVGIECELTHISAASLVAEQQTVWRLASGCPEPAPHEDVAGARYPRGLLFELADRPAGAAAALAAIRADRSFDAIVAIASLTVECIDWFIRASDFDDFLLYPWSPVELIGRIHAAERRRLDAGLDGITHIGEEISMDQATRQATVNGRSVRLTTRECALLSYLCTHRGSVLSRNHLLQHVWGQTYHGGPRTVDVHIRRLRSKLGSALRIDTVRGGGYRLHGSMRAAHRLREFPAAQVC